MRRSTSHHRGMPKKSKRSKRSNSTIPVDRPPILPDRQKHEYDKQILTEYKNDLHISIDRAERLWNWYHNMNTKHKEMGDVNEDLDFTVYSEIEFFNEEWTAEDFKAVHEQLDEDYNGQIKGMVEDFQHELDDYKIELEDYNEQFEERRSSSVIEDVSLPRTRGAGEYPTQGQINNRPEFLKSGIGARFMVSHDEFIANNPDHWSIPTERFISGVAVNTAKSFK